MGALKTILNILYEAVVTIIVKYHIVAIPLYYFDCSQLLKSNNNE